MTWSPKKWTSALLTYCIWYRNWGAYTHMGWILIVLLDCHYLQTIDWKFCLFCIRHLNHFSYYDRIGEGGTEGGFYICMLWGEGGYHGCWFVHLRLWRFHTQVTCSPLMIIFTIDHWPGLVGILRHKGGGVSSIGLGEGGNHTGYTYLLLTYFEYWERGL